MWGDASEQEAFARVWPLWHGDPSVRDRRRAVRALTRLAEAGYAPARFAVGWAYFDGDGVRRNYATAFRYFRDAAEQGYPSAEGMVGAFYAMVRPKHDACEHDPEEAARWHRRAAEHGNAGAQANLASACWTGLGVPRDAVETCVWASVSVHCSTLRNRPAEVLRDQAAAELGPGDRSAAAERIARLIADLPKPWSEHMGYWKMLAERAGAIGPAPY